MDAPFSAGERPTVPDDHRAWNGAALRLRADLRAQLLQTLAGNAKAVGIVRGINVGACRDDW